jgi:hypothetical protein
MDTLLEGKQLSKFYIFGESKARPTSFPLLLAQLSSFLRGGSIRREEEMTAHAIVV